VSDLEKIVKEIVAKNDWLNGMYDYRDGDIMAIVNQPEKFESITITKNLKKLYDYLNNFDGVYKYRN